MFQQGELQPDFAKQEEEILEFWQKQEIFQQSMEKNKGGKTYVIYDGPPTANAKPPLHTMVPMSFKDLVGRYKTMQGYYVPRQVGWDTHGLPVEVQVEKALGLSGKKEILNLVPGDPSASIRKFNEACRTSVWEFKQAWDQFVPRVGYWSDSKHPYITYDASYIEKVWGVFKQIWDKDLVYKGYKVLPYCPRCGTALSAAEVGMEYQEVKDTSVYVTFPLVDKPKRAFLSWTTTPWTLPGNVALAVGEDIDYVVVEQENQQEYILAKSRLEILKEDYTIIAELKGRELVGMKYVPLFPEVLADQENAGKHSVLPASFVTTSEGTGIVHTAVMYGEDDFNLGVANDLPMVHSVAPDGTFLERAGKELAGLYIRDALGVILTSLQQKERLYAKQSITHSYPFCWRCKTALMYYAKDSWFIAMSRLRDQLVQNNDQVAWFPGHIKEGRFGDFIREARDWAISRERFWGTPLPVWVSESGKFLCVGSFEELKAYAKQPELIGTDFDPHRPQVDDIVLMKDGEEYKREPLVMDVWFDSGAMPYASGRDAQQQFPADYIAEAIDQTRGWFNSLLAISTIIKDGPAYLQVTCMGHLVDEQGKKMSKSGPNSVNPTEVFATVGVDALRWYLYTVNPPGEAKAFSLKDIQSSFRRSLLLLWNMSNYFITYANVLEVDAPTEAERKTLRENKNLPVLDRWVISRQAATLQEVTAYLEAYDFMRAGRCLEEYINDLSTWYLRRSRKRIDQQFFWLLYDILLNCITLLAPFTPFLTEKMYQQLRRDTDPQSLHLTAWPTNLGTQAKEEEIHMQVIRQLVELGLALRAQEKIKVRQPLSSVQIMLASEQHISKELLAILADELNVLSVEVVKEADSTWPQKTMNEMTLALDVTVTEALEQAGLARELLRQLQQLRKNKGLQPGQNVTLLAGPDEKSYLLPLFEQFPFILSEAFLQLDEKRTWVELGVEEIEVDGRTLLIDYVATL